MKKKIFKIIVIFIIMMCVYRANSYAVALNNIQLAPPKSTKMETDWLAPTYAETKKYIKDNFGYDYNKEKWFEVRTTMTLSTKSFGRKYVAFGSSGKIKINEETYNLLKGNNETVENEEVVIRISVYSQRETSADTAELISIYINITDIYTGEDIPTQLSKSDEKNKDKEDVQNEWSSDSPFKKLLNNLRENAPGTVGSIVLELLRTIFGDLPQMVINMFQTVPMGLVGIGKEIGNMKITYGYDVYNDTGDPRNEYVKASEYQDSGTHKITIKGEDEKFDEETEIPFIPVDLYAMATGRIDIFDINFLTGQNTKRDGAKVHADNSIWLAVRNFVTLIIRITIYVVAAFLLTTLIWHGINIVKGSLDNPMAKAMHREGLKDFITSFLMLIGVVLVMAIGIYASDMFFDVMQEDSSTKQLPIRVNVENAKYSFSTNATGYVRYMSQIQNVNMCEEKAQYTFAYIILVWLNVIGILTMMVRYIGMLVLSAIGPVIVALHAVHREDIIKLGYGDWAKYYLGLSLIQLIFSMAYMLILKSAI